MNDLLNTLFGLDDIRIGDEGVALSFATGYEPWLWAVLIAAAIGFAGWSYSRLDGSRAARVTLAGLRSSTLIALLVLLAGPQAVVRDELVEPDWVALLIDRSASLTIADAPGIGPARITREEQLRRAIDTSSDELGALSERRRLLVLGFDAGTSAVSLDEIGNPDGRRTSIRYALDDALARTAARPLAGVVVVSDGRSADTPSRAALRRLRREAAPVFVIPLGSAEPVGDLAIRATRAPRLAFTNDRTPVSVEIERLGGEGQARGTVRLVDEATGLVIDQQPVTFDPSERTDDGPAQTVERVMLRADAAEEGRRTWRVELVPDQDDLLGENNTRDLPIEFVGRPLRVLHIDGYPRWEQRYLRSLLIREETVNASTLVLAPDRRYLQEGDTEIGAIPTSAETWREYDAIVLGDVRPDVFTTAQLESLREHIATTGAAIVWSAGPSSVPVLWHDTPLGELLPFLRGASDGRSIESDTTMRPTGTADLLGVLRLSADRERPWPPELSDPDTGWSRLRYTQRIDASMLKPTARILAESVPVSRDAEENNPPEPPGPAVVLMRFGAGSSLYIATDETWRWRYGRGETLFERFWLQLIRALARDRLTRTDRAASLTASPGRAVVEQPVLITLDVFDQRLGGEAPSSVEVEMVRSDEGASPAQGNAAPMRLTLRRSAGSGDGDTNSEGDPEARRGLVYAATWLPPAPGSWTARLADRTFITSPLDAPVDVSWPVDELRRPETDHAALARLAEETGGQVLSTDQLADLDEILPNRERRVVAVRTEPIWDAPIVLVMLLLLLTAEWLGRRAIRLV